MSDETMAVEKTTAPFEYDQLDDLAAEILNGLSNKIELLTPIRGEVYLELELGKEFKKLFRKNEFEKATLKIQLLTENYNLKRS